MVENLRSTEEKPEVRLTWKGPYKLRDFFGNPDLDRTFSCPGVYIWIERKGSDECLSYVGKASGSPTLARRQRQHYAFGIGGLYTIPSEFRKMAKERWVPDWSKPDVYEVLLERSRFHMLVDDAFNYIDACDVHLARAASGGEAKLIERQLLFDLQPTGTKWGCRSPPGYPIRLVHRRATWASAAIRHQLEGRNVAFE